MFKYDVYVTFDFSKKCGMDKLNEMMSQFGFTEKALVLSGPHKVVELEYTEELTHEGLRIMEDCFKRTLEKEFTNDEVGINKVEIQRVVSPLL